QAVGTVRRFLPLLILLLAACGGESDVGTDGAPTKAPDAITAPDSGKTFTLAPGSETSLRLSSEYDWSEPVVEGESVALSPVDYLQDPGFSEWLVQATGAGTATISSVGEPACEGEHGCPDEAFRFQVTITVAE
ncbi:MAG: hypothetical protein ACRDPP_07265, partial [Gaiellaceae bacterium]